ncbi:MAG: type II secretion system F family protein [Burkholderiales bacterium]
MPAYRYKAIDRLGRRTSGQLEANNEADLELRLKRINLDLITYRQLRTDASAFRRGTINRRDLITLCFDLEQISRAGIPIIDGLRDLRTHTPNPRFREVLSSLVEDIEGGKMLSQGMSAFPTIFSPVFVSLVKAGEQAGRLTEVFENLANSLKWHDELASQTRRLLIYPAFVLVVVLSAMMFLLVFLVPQVVSLLKNMGMALPLQTRILIGISEFTTKYWPLILAFPVLTAAGLAASIRTNPRAAYLFDYAKLHLPVIGPILQKIILARFANFFALMYKSGITILDAIKTSEDVVGNKVIAEALQRAGQQISAGESLSNTFQSLGLFPALVVRMMRVGEATGALDTALQNINYFYSRDVKDSVEKALKLLEPMLTLILGLLLLLILYSVLTPVYDIIGNLKF